MATKSESMKEWWASASEEVEEKRAQAVKLGKSKFIDITGDKYGRLVVLGPKGRNENGYVLWECLCDCGNKITTTSNLLREGNTKSCGCLFLEHAKSGRAHFIHGKSKTPEYTLWNHAKQRALELGLSFTLKLEDIKIPERCPVLGILLKVGKGKQHDASPTIDKIDNTRGYDGDNFWVISHRANRLKNDASLSELKLLVQALEKRLS